MKEIIFVDQTLRDAQQSLWGFRMSTDMLSPIIPVMDDVGYKTIATVGARGIIVTMRAYQEDPWERIHILTNGLKKTPVRGSFQPWNLQGFGLEPLASIELWIKRQIAHGMKSFWVCDYQNMMDKLSYLVRIAKAEGTEVVVAILYTVSPVHTDDHFAQKMKKLADMCGVDAVHLEDASGVMTVERARTLLPAMQREAKGIPIEFHSHCTIGLAPQSYAEAIKLGITTLHTAVSPLANDTSLPSIENTIKNVRSLGYTTNLNEEALKKESDYFRKTAEDKGLRIGTLREYDVSQFDHQLPGGMTGTLRNQLAEVNQENRLDEVLKEIVNVRRDFGYPVMATPYAQIVGAQSLFNIISGERYKIVSNEVIQYMMGWYGEPAGPVDQNVKDNILNSPMAKKLLKWMLPELTIQDLHREIGSNLSEDELLLQLLDPQGEVKEKLDILYGKKL